MTVEEKQKAANIKAKLIAGIKLTDEEQLFYLVNVLKYTEEQALNMKEISQNKGNLHTLID